MRLLTIATSCVVMRSSNAAPNRTNIESNVDGNRLREAAEIVIGLAKRFEAKYLNIPIGDDTNTQVRSGLSNFLFLSLILQASRGTTRTRLMDGLGFNDHDPQIIQLGLKLLSGCLNINRDITLVERTEIHFPVGFSPAPAFIESAEKVFHLSTLTFDPQMFTLIKHEIGEPTEMPHVVFFNYLAFNGSWDIDFNVLSNSKQLFYVNGINPVKTEYLYALGEYRYGELENLHSRFIEIPFKSNDKTLSISMFIIVPNRHKSYKQLVSKLGTIDVGELIRDYPEEEVRVFLPAFDIMSTISSKDWIPQIFTSGNPFEPCANFSEICLENSFDDVRSKVGIRVRGTNMTGWTIDRTLKMRRQPRSLHTRQAIKFNVNYPFVGIIATTGVAIVNLATFTVSGSIFNSAARRPPYPKKISKSTSFRNVLNAGLTKH